MGRTADVTCQSCLWWVSPRAAYTPGGQEDRAFSAVPTMPHLLGLSGSEQGPGRVCQLKLQTPALWDHHLQPQSPSGLSLWAGATSAGAQDPPSPRPPRVSSQCSQAGRGWGTDPGEEAAVTPLRPGSRPGTPGRGHLSSVPRFPSVAGRGGTRWGQSTDSPVAWQSMAPATPSSNVSRGPNPAAHVRSQDP